MFKPTVVSAALAGAFSGLLGPWLWARYGGPGQAGSVELIAGMLLLVVLPAHAGVLGMGQPAQTPGSGGIDKALLRRIVAWLAAALLTVGLMR